MPEAEAILYIPASGRTALGFHTNGGFVRPFGSTRSLPYHQRYFLGGENQIYRLTRVLTRGDEEAEDLAQETFIRAFRAVGQFRGDSSFETWLHHIAVNVVRSHLARWKNRRPDVSVTQHHEDERGPLELGSGENLETDVMRRCVIDRDLASLPDEARAVITLRDVQGLGYQEIATILGVPIGTIESRIFRARRRLRPMLEPLLGRPRRERRI
jgi:RNA polymerase sigma-70 factor, ECF subfamily